MAIVKWEPFGELLTLRRQMDHLMESFFGREPLNNLTTSGTKFITDVKKE